MIELKKIKKPTKIYAEVIEDGALTQFVDVMNHPAITRGALMPDVHKGYTLPIGGVVESDGLIFPSFVGYDIGCGMCAVQTSFPVTEIQHNANKIYDEILDLIPVGYDKHSRPVKEVPLLPPMSETMKSIYAEKSGHLQLGTLGGGNHFIEIGYDTLGEVWIVIHSGSRGVGHGCASHYMKIASPNGKASEGIYGLDVNSPEGQNYIEDMNWCLDFALLNRIAMINLAMLAINNVGVKGNICGESINRNHNHAESKDGRFWIHRKGATHAEKGMMGVIPGNMRDGSFIVMGKGCEDSLYSSSHGAGRVLGRKAAKEVLSEDEFILTMDGIVANVGQSTLDESPFAYKDIYTVMDLQDDLVEVVDHVRPIINVKG